jgi:hypothetical protein
LRRLRGSVSLTRRRKGTEIDALRARDHGCDFYVASPGDNTIVRMGPEGSMRAIRPVTVNGNPLDNVALNGIAASPDRAEIYLTFNDPNDGRSRGLALVAC